MFEVSDGCLAETSSWAVALWLWSSEGRAGRALDGEIAWSPAERGPWLARRARFRPGAGSLRAHTLAALCSSSFCRPPLKCWVSLQPGGASRTKQRLAHPPCSQALLLVPAAGRELSACLQSEVPGELEAVTLPESLTPVT